MKTTDTTALPPVHVMLDIETLGVRPGAVIFQVAAARFCPDSGATLSEFSADIDIDDALFWGLHIERDTHAWWEKQGGIRQEDPITLAKAIYQLNTFLRYHLLGGRSVIWARGMDFDFPLLRHAYAAVRADPPWVPWQQRDLRTITKLTRTDPPVASASHTAIEDVRAQCIQCALALAFINASDPPARLPDSADIPPMPVPVTGQTVDQLAAALRITD